MKFRYLLAGASLAVLAPVATAQSADAYFDSTNTFTVSTSDPSVTIQQDPNNPSGFYQNFSPSTSGDGINYGNGNYGSYDFMPDTGTVFADAESYSAANGMATQFSGENFNMIFTNTSGIDQTVSMSFDVVENLSAYGDAVADAYGGWEINGYQQIGYFTNTLVGGGTVQGNYSGFTGGFNGSSWEGTDSFTYDLAAGQTIQVQAWASGDTSAIAPTPTPEPATLSLGIGAIAMAIKKRRSNRSA